MSETDERRPTCSFCGRSRRQVRRLLAGPVGVAICDGCVEQCTELLADDDVTSPEPEPDVEAAAYAEPATRPTGALPRPMEVHALLDEYVIGQDQAKRVLSIAVCHHYRRLAARSVPVGRHAVPDDTVELGKSDVLLIGPTGSGKTYLAQTLARVLDVPFAMADATALTAAGYVGEDVESMAAALLRAADHDVARAETGIIYLDEVDKIARRGSHPSSTRDVSGEGVQHALLSMLSGRTVEVPLHGAPGAGAGRIPLDLSNVLFILGGAFAGLDRIIQARSGGGGFGFDVGSRSRRVWAEARTEVLPADLQEFGLIPEFVGRLPVVSMLEPLDVPALARALTVPRNALISQYRRLFALDGVLLEFTEGAVHAVAEQALRRGTGARAARAVLEEVLLDPMYEVPSRTDVSRVVITRDAVLDKADARRRSSASPDVPGGMRERSA
ncbi:ATP-dependent Clp protease ATP-binding subunit ClpX [Actinoalloteichus hoggarensis]|uniref:ATP-dependent Clp protease ATP-binding subunit ClpX n=1 Tax=Actinoalloteichus hoggarensis TaxID=1470176 RepID=A0A221W8N6_9PSEU|nr:ATP-dependent Clp protease ATP-binding subunit ClpX [Actinoalloteichus hoggarensis]ASO21707.1 ATP-dependent Clp protease ATP-binding subunit ClpX [Actinoalloteichus hoggarensis]MBB5922301.1 ATP-dependent Clp protease ATP-binding subunit ClpX [Actinoalloteichus hoggarensis]